VFGDYIMARFIPIAKPVIGDEEVDLVVKVLRSGRLAQGPMVREFEERFAEYIGVDYAIAVSNGTCALDLMLKAYGIKSGDEVITTPFTFIATANAILYQGAKPVFVDIDLETYNIDPDRVLEAITSKTKAILVVHLYGHPAEMKALREIAEDHKLLLLEDAAQAHGAEYMGVKVGALGNAAAFSFYPTKNITTGEGGMITTNDRSVAEKLRILRDQGQQGKYNHVVLGYNYRMTEIQAAIGIAQLGKIEKFLKAREANAEFLTRNLKKIPYITTPSKKPYVRHAWHQYVIRVKENSPLKRDYIAETLKNMGIQTAIHYPKPVHHQPLYRSLGYPQNICPNAIKASKTVLSIPVHPALTVEDLNYIVNSIIKLFEKHIE